MSAAPRAARGLLSFHVCHTSTAVQRTASDTPPSCFGPRCAKYRINHIDFGNLPGTGLPRLLDMGQVRSGLQGRACFLSGDACRAAVAALE